MSLVLAGVSVAQSPTTNDGWQSWWELNKAPFLNLKKSIHDAGVIIQSDGWIRVLPLTGSALRESRTMKPTKATIVTRILPTLQKALDTTTNREIKTSCLLAFAKIGKNHPDFKILDIFKEHLASSDQKVHETAALAMGISQMPDAVVELIALATDSSKGRAVADRNPVDDRSRSFATYGLGLVAHGSSSFEIKETVFKALKDLLETEGIVNRDLKVAAIHGMSLLNPGLEDERSRKLLTDCLATLERYYVKDPGSGDLLIRAHVPPAIAKLLLRVEDEQLAVLKEHCKRLFLSEIAGKSRLKHRTPEITQSCALALGQMARPFKDEGGNSLDDQVSRALHGYYKNGEDEHARQFCLLALAQIGGAANRSALLKALEEGDEAAEKPWAAIGLGVFAFNVAQADSHAEVDYFVGDALRLQFAKAENQDTRAALAIALGLTRYGDAADDLREMLLKDNNKDEFTGYLCIGLALMDDRHAIEQITNIVKTSERRPERLRQAAIALGKLGDKRVTQLLQDMMTTGSQSSAKMSAIASALGFIGDRRTIEPLTKMLFNESLTDLSRAFAAVALGGVADKELLRWNSKIAVNMNYRAAVETLTDGAFGILDIL